MSHVIAPLSINESGNEMTTFDDDGVDDEYLASLDLDILCCNEKTLKHAEPEQVTLTNVDVLCQNTDDNETVKTHDFGFPYEAYSIQNDFMNGLYYVIKNRKHGIFESPTGTVICGALRWLFDEIQSWKDELNELNQKNENDTSTTSSDDWLQRIMKRKDEEDAKEKRREQLQTWIDLENNYGHTKNSLAASIKKTARDFDKEYRRLFNCEISKSDLDSQPIVSLNKVKDDNDDDVSDEELIVKDPIIDDYLDSSTTSEQVKEKKNHVLKIFYCTRTHSQISQFIQEIQKTQYCDKLRIVALGSRQNLCINESVLKLKSVSLINERCLELQKKKKEKKTTRGKRQKTACGCSYLQHDRVECLTNDILGDVQDIEDVVKVGREMEACPYYASRSAIAGAHLVLLPYQTLLHKSTRDACGIKLQDNIVIIDEAHNLPDAVCTMHSTEITGTQLIESYGQLTRYYEKYKNRLTAKNLLSIKQLLDVQLKLIKTLTSQENLPPFDSEKWANIPVSSQNETCVSDVIRYLSDADIYVNLFELLSYIQTSEITKKLYGFITKYQFKSTSNDEKKPNESALQKLLQKQVPLNNKPSIEQQPETTIDQKISNTFALFVPFLEALTNPRENGKVILTKKRTKTVGLCTIKFYALKPSSYFKEIVNETRCVIVAGGTMKPVSEFVDHLFIACGQSKERIYQLSCGHIVPETNVLAIGLPCGPNNVEFEFTAANRSNISMMDELGRLLISLTSTIPHGIVIFFCSYDHLQKAYTHFEKTFVLNKILPKKKIFMEPKRSGDVETVLTNYTKAIKNKDGSGALLFSVVGGKMSEGINFSNELARCVCVIGLPYANIGSSELIEKMKYLDLTQEKSSSCESGGRAYYENTCWKAVNQSIGRAIRHKNDYACLLLVDKRYSKQNVLTKLPHWLEKSFMRVKNFSEASSSLNKFFSQPRGV
ncbi:unnamed protein product [Didymodactylos carnosus]|uniref:DNA 5'-3' helicase n=1 Tax=Didymodactylos carnosus TaxID=1234261 RepID=A0A813QLN6_9BILA|nr:unnamed protein product [Didymodactylos carnosus]CAF0768344.1 unnamed protein product [Didymodactylos carnosus]CAF3514537.1 unnamed protein product [Didymodactylos carnosus]CAF3550158.1 unnamed protein product [Didymodactylos carnosus]